MKKPIPTTLPPYFVKRVGNFGALAETVPWGIKRSNLDDVWQITTGQQVTACVLDTGFSNHPDNCNEIEGQSFCWESDVTDFNGHGSHVAGTIGACSNDSGVVGVAPDVPIINHKIMDKFGMGDDRSFYESLQWCYNNHKDIDVVNVSMGSPAKMGRHISSMLKKLKAKGVAVICAAGNAGRNNSVSYPARDVNVTAIAAHDSRNRIATFSSRGPEVDHAAPGVDILSTYKDQQYSVLDGTSMATPYYVGLIALAISARRLTGKKDLPLDDLNKIAIHHSIDHGPKGTDNKFGHGIVDPLGFVQAVRC